MIAKWKRPGGKLREEGAANLTDSELIAILISTGIRGKTALEIAQEILEKFGLTAKSIIESAKKAIKAKK